MACLPFIIADTSATPTVQRSVLVQRHWMSVAATDLGDYYVW